MRFDIYSPSTNQSSYDFTATVSTRLNVLSDPKQIKEHLRLTVSAEADLPQKPSFPRTRPAPHLEPLAESSSWALSPSPYSITASDSPAEVLVKFLCLVALGPIKHSALQNKLDPKHIIPPNELKSMIATHTQAYLSQDTFIEDDVFPNIDLGATKIDSTAQYIILKDKAYKELRPCQWSFYTDYERSLILENANNALSRLGYLDTHPLRKRIAEKTHSAPPLKKHTALGGGLLANSKKSSTTHNSPKVQPASPLTAVQRTRRPATESPELDLNSGQLRARKLRVDGSPGKTSSKRKFVYSLSLSAASSDDEKAVKRSKTNGVRSNSNGSTVSTTSTTGRNASHGTLPSSVNEDGASDERSDDDVKLLIMAKHPSIVPPRPQSALSITNAEKKQQYYSQLAMKFRSKYREYEKLHRTLTSSFKKGGGPEKKKQLTRLFEMHNCLSEWKKKLWDYHNENNLTEGIMNLSRHRKSNNTLSAQVNGVSPTRSIGSLNFNKAHTTSPAIGSNERFGHQKQQHYRQSSSTIKVALDY